MADLILSSNISTIAFISFPCNVSIQCLNLNDRCISFTLCKSLWRNTTWRIWIPNEAVESLDPLLCWETYKQWKEYRTKSMNEKTSLSEGNWVNPSRRQAVLIEEAHRWTHIYGAVVALSSEESIDTRSGGESKNYHGNKQENIRTRSSG